MLYVYLVVDFILKFVLLKLKLLLFLRCDLWLHSIQVILVWLRIISTPHSLFFEGILNDPKTTWPSLGSLLDTADEAGISLFIGHFVVDRLFFGFEVFYKQLHAFCLDNMSFVTWSVFKTWEKLLEQYRKLFDALKALFEWDTLKGIIDLGLAHPGLSTLRLMLSQFPAIISTLKVDALRPFLPHHKTRQCSLVYMETFCDSFITSLSASPFPYKKDLAWHMRIFDKV